MLFLGDSILERFTQDAPQVWNAYMVPRAVLNAGVNGDRTENLLWRLQHGNLAGPAPDVAVVLIGTNDLTNDGNPRSPDMIAEGIRANLLSLRQRLPTTRILLLGLLPRGSSPEVPLRLGTVAVNRLMATCADDRSIFWVDVGGVLLDSDRLLSRDIAPDLLHFSPLGYERFARRLVPEIDRLLIGAASSARYQPNATALPAAAVTYKADENGRFVVAATVNGTPIQFLVDTGADRVVLSIKDALRAGITLSKIEALGRAGIAGGGSITTLRTTVREIRLDRFVVRDVETSIVDDGDALLGLSFLRRLPGFRISGRMLTIDD